MTGTMEEFDKWSRKRCVLDGWVSFSAAQSMVSKRLHALAAEKSLGINDGFQGTWQGLLTSRAAATREAHRQHASQKYMLQGLRQSQSHDLSLQSQALMDTALGAAEAGPSEVDLLFDLSGNSWHIARSSSRMLFTLQTGAFLRNEELQRPALLEELFAIQGIPVLVCPFLSAISSMPYAAGAKIVGNSINVSAIGEFMLWLLSRLHTWQRALVAKPPALISGVIGVSDSDSDLERGCAQCEQPHRRRKASGDCGGVLIVRGTA